MFLKLVGKIHGGLIFGRRVEALARHLAEALPENASVLDVGCGSGDIAAAVMALRPDVRIAGIDVLVRPGTKIPVTGFSGGTIPHGDKSFDAVIFVDVLHHADDPQLLLNEARRVAGKMVLVKDHLAENALQHFLLKLMDWVGNRPHGVVLKYEYWSRAQWSGAFEKAGLTPAGLDLGLGIYLWPLSMIFGGSLQALYRLVPSGG